MRTELLSFEVENYRSFCEAQRLELGEDSSRGVTMLFGPNAGGKSNVAKALACFCNAIVNSANASWHLPYDPFLLREGWDNRPCKLTARFVSSDGKYLEYSFSFTATAVTHERLRERSANSKKMKTVFERDEAGIVNSAAVRSGFSNSLLAKTRPDTLLVSKGREDNVAYANYVYELASSIVVISDEMGMDGGRSPYFVNLLKRDEGLRSATVDFLKKCDFAIQGFSIEDVSIPGDALDALPLLPETKAALVQSGATAFKTLHVIRDSEQSVVGTRELDFWGQESTGTQRFFREIVPIIDAIRRGGTVYVDEFGTSVHAELSKTVLRLFREGGEEGRARASLIACTQNLALMSKLSREEIVLVDKTMAEESRITPLTNLSVRSGEAFEKRYRAGLYGAVPIVEQ
ncbi:MAG TPA: AAA family ATPase [Candidatus Olsenella pullistercoris]|uniref:AAA family ATPase n=1 Tax=Candidatus Olsenella pullistercoris TaxID=2838712 RepID=A0A9D2EY80_9ACTN|nr:AAA family ATPase [Candidatus Olsenella pullistercoris]